ncbi:Protease, Ulp1 family [Phaffia rhodozyma]|uniref:Protease, Ulp1 family n=1 Tax=Phaffia rhodozyma TaxID=264483 RepID=A0A0F7SY25_PHARH|nr:Protease, Ulp1 family [Phaffia rhodozyma]
MEKFPVPNKTLSRIKSKSGALLRTKSSSRSSALSSLSQDKGKTRAVDNENPSREQSQNDKDAAGSFPSERVINQARSLHLSSTPSSKRLRLTQHPPTSSPSPPPPNPNILPTRSPSPVLISTPPRVRAEPIGETRSFISDQHVFTSPFTFTTKEDRERVRAGILREEGSADSGRMTEFSSSSSSSNLAQSARSSPEVNVTSRPIRQASRALRSGLIITDRINPDTRKQRKYRHKQSAALSLTDGQNTMCVWKSQGRGEIRITRADFYRTTVDEGYLNDTLIEFGLKECFHRATIRNPELADKVHIFNSFLYMKLTDPAVTRKGLDPWETVKRWTMGKVDLFEKKYLVVPINENYHWYMAIIVNPRAIIPSPPLSKSLADQTVKEAKKSSPAQKKVSTYAPRRSTRGRNDSNIREVAEGTDAEVGRGDDREMEAAQERITPYIFLFDSFGTSRPQPGHVLTRYLCSEAIASSRLEEGADVQPLVHRKADVPTQHDFSSCGVYLLHYADVFFSDPDLAVQQILAQPMKKTAKIRARIDSARDVFWRSTELGDKREDISNRILRIEAEWKASRATDIEERAKEETIEEEDIDIEEHNSPHSRSSSEVVPDSIPMDYILSLESEQESQTIYERMRLAFPSSAATSAHPGGMDDSVSSSITIDPLSESRSDNSDLLKYPSLNVEAVGENLSASETRLDKELPREGEIVFSTLRSHISPTPSPDCRSRPGQSGTDDLLSFSITRPSSPPSISPEERLPVDSVENPRSGLRVSLGETTSDLISTLPSHLSPTPSPPPRTLPSTAKHEALSPRSIKPLSSEVIPSSVDDRPRFLLGKPEDESNESRREDGHLTERFIPNSPLSLASALPLTTAEAVHVSISPNTTHSNSSPLVLQQRTGETSDSAPSLTAKGKGKGKRRRVEDSSEIFTPALRKSTRSTNDRAE